MKTGKKYADSLKLIDRTKQYDPEEAIYYADVLIVGGTSLTVQPAASFVSYFRGNYLIIINKESTSLDKYATLVFHESVGDVLDEALKDM